MAGGLGLVEVDWVALKRGDVEILLVPAGCVFALSSARGGLKVQTGPKVLGYQRGTRLGPATAGHKWLLPECVRQGPGDQQLKRGKAKGQGLNIAQEG